MLKAPPPFVYLSAVLQQYADCGYLLRSCDDNSEAAAIFGRFLAELIKSGKVLLFDVHTLNLAKDEEVVDIIEYLQNYSTSITHPLNVGIQYGLDYCVDTVSLNNEVKQIGKLPRLEYRSALSKPRESSKKFPVTPEVFVDTTLDPSDWPSDEPKIPLRLSFMNFQLFKGREEDAIARQRSQEPPPKIGPRRVKTAPPPQPRDRSNYMGARKVERLPSTFSDTRYFNPT